MAWVEGVPLLLVLALAAWIFLRPYPGDAAQDDPPNDRDDSP